MLSRLHGTQATAALSLSLGHDTSGDHGEAAGGVQEGAGADGGLAV